MLPILFMILTQINPGVKIDTRDPKMTEMKQKTLANFQLLQRIMEVTWLYNRVLTLVKRTRKKICLNTPCHRTYFSHKSKGK
jgi:hypothetical protein